MLKIYGYAASINVRKVLWACEELGLEFQREDWGGGFSSTSEPEFKALNPVGMVPVIDDAGTIRNPAFQDPVAIANSVQLFTAMVGIVDAQLGSTGAYIACERFTAADIAIGLAIHRWFSTPIPRPSFVNVDRYYERLLERTGFRRYGRDGGP